MQRPPLSFNRTSTLIRQYRLRLALGAAVTVLCLVLLRNVINGPHNHYGWTLRENPPPGPEEIVLEPLFSLNGSPTLSFRDNLLTGVKYITGWNRGGLTKESVTWIKLIHLAYMAQRIPILPPLLPDEQHLGLGGRSLDASDIYDIPHLSKALNLPILEWSQLKSARFYKPIIPSDKEAHEDDEVLGCWSIHQDSAAGGKAPHMPTPHFLHLNVQYTSVPPNASNVGGLVDYKHLLDVLSPSGRDKALRSAPQTWAENPLSSPPGPDDHLACFDDLYPVGGGIGIHQWKKDPSRTWELIGTNLHFARSLEIMANGYLRSIFGLGRLDVIPPFISVHIRRGDQQHFCGTLSRQDCLPPLSAYVHQVQEVQKALTRLHGHDSLFSDIRNVIVTSDETDPEWWAEVEGLGWKETRSFKYELEMSQGVWFPPIIDAVIQSRGAGFVGTSGSLMSVIAAKRVSDWQGGPSKLVYRKLGTNIGA